MQTGVEIKIDSRNYPNQEVPSLLLTAMKNGVSNWIKFEWNHLTVHFLFQHNLWPFAITYLLMDWAMTNSSRLQCNGVGGSKHMAPDRERVPLSLCITRILVWWYTSQKEWLGWGKIIFLFFLGKQDGERKRKIKNVTIWFAGRFVWLSWILYFAAKSVERKLSKGQMIRNWNNLSCNYNRTLGWAGPAAIKSNTLGKGQLQTYMFKVC